MKLYIVSRTINGYAREDSLRSSVVGVYSDQNIAELVRKGSGGDATVSELELEHIPTGIQMYLKELGVKHSVLGNEAHDTLGMP